MRLPALLAVFTLPLAAVAQVPPVAEPAGVEVPPGNVVLVTLDGVRWQDFLDDKPDRFLADGDRAPTMPVFWARLAAQGALYPHMSVSNRATLSMPAYQSIFAGFRQPCADNDCARVSVETFPERLVREGVPRAQVATFASWEKIPRAVESREGATFTDAGEAGHTRLDADTFPRALAYLKANKPRFLFISLNDTDAAGHAGDYAAYLAAMRRDDGWIADLCATLDAMGSYGKSTTLIVTTDHGRGVLWDWVHHGHRPWAKRVFLWARGPYATKGLTGAGGEHADLRPTIESLLGLAPKTCPGCGAPLAGVAP